VRGLKQFLPVPKIRMRISTQRYEPPYSICLSVPSCDLVVTFSSRVSRGMAMKPRINTKSHEAIPKTMLGVSHLQFSENILGGNAFARALRRAVPTQSNRQSTIGNRK